MDAIILVGGQGTRLRPLTERRHKSLVPLCNRPAIEYLFEWIARSGFERAVLSLGQHNEDLARQYPPGSHCGIHIDIVQESERLESGGAIRYAVQQAGVEGRFVVLNGDVFVDFDFDKALRAHESSRAELTIALFDVTDPSAFGVAVTDNDGLITKFVEKPQGIAPSNAVNAGVWIFEPGLVDDIPPGAVRVEQTLFPSLVDAHRRVLGYRFEGPWQDIGTPERYLELNMQLLDSGTAGIAASANIAPAADVERSVIGAGTTISDMAVVRNSVLWENVIVGEGACIADSVIANDVTIGKGVNVAGVSIGPGASIRAHTNVRERASIAGETRYHGSDER
jgi:mannose-1-phosphate guanylyltransferase